MPEIRSGLPSGETTGPVKSPVKILIQGSRVRKTCIKKDVETSSNHFELQSAAAGQDDRVAARVAVRHLVPGRIRSEAAFAKSGEWVWLCQAILTRNTGTKMRLVV